jgi:hypothetical protein
MFRSRHPAHEEEAAAQRWPEPNKNATMRLYVHFAGIGCPTLHDAQHEEHERSEEAP